MGRPRKYESDDPAERKRMNSAAYYARHREQVKARQAEYRQRPGVKERIKAQRAEYRQRPEVKKQIKAYRRAADRLSYRKMKLDPERYERYLAFQRRAIASRRANRKERADAE